LDKVN